MRRTLTSGFKLLARLIGLGVDPIRVYRLLGVVPLRRARLEEFAPAPFPPEAPPPASFASREGGTGEQRRPRSIDPANRWKASAPNERTMAHIVRIHGGVATAGGHVFTSRGWLIPGACHKDRPQQKTAWVGDALGPRPRIPHFACRVGVLTASSHELYFHWLLDVLPRLEMLRRTGAATDRLYLQQQRPFQTETLKRLGVEPAAILDCDRVPILSATELVVPCHEVMMGREVPRWVCSWLRECMLPDPKDGEAALQHSPERLFVSRRGAGHRRVTNEQEISERLARRGFVDVQLEALSVDQQVRLFHGARAVVAPHGGGLANLVFCEPGTKVVELFPAATMDLYFRLSCAVGLDHWVLPARIGDCERLGLGDYWVDPDALERTLDRAGL